MWSDVGFNYNSVNANNYTTPLTVKKTVKESKAWQKSVLDDFERIGIEQLSENSHFQDYYRMVDGDMSYRELSEVIPELSNVQDLLDGVGVPTFLKHYDLIGIIINVLVGNYMEMRNKFHVTDTGEIANNEFLREKNTRLQGVIKEQIDAEIELHLVKLGIDPNRKNFQNQEEQQAYIQQLQQKIQELTPAHIEGDLKKSWKTIGIKWGESILEQDRERFQLDRLEIREFKDYLLTGRCFRHYRIGYDYYKPESWSPLNTFFSQTVDSQYVQDGEYAGRIHFQTPTEVLKNHGHNIDTKTQKQFLGGNEDWKNFVDMGNTTVNNAITSNFHQQVIAPHANYFDYNFALNIQDSLGIPMGEYTPINDTNTYDRFLPRRHGENNYTYSRYANTLRNDLNIRTDLCQVTEVFFIAYDLIGYLTYQDEETGEVFNEIVTEDILTEFVKDRNIKNVKTSKLVDVNEEFELNTLKWFYRPVCYEGVKINSYNLDEPLYLYCRPCDHQIKGDSNTYDVKLPVAGFIGKGLAKKISPYQTKFNLCMNQIYSLLEKEIGVFFLMDVQFIPSEFKDNGSAEDALLSLRNIAKDIGVMPIATGGDSARAQSTFNNFSPINISMTAQIQSRQSLAEYFKQKAYELIGINAQQLGAPNKYTNEEGIKASQDASYAQTAEIYENFSHYTQKTLELHLSIAQYAQGEGKDITISYTRSDSSLAFLQFTDENLQFRKIGLIPSDDNKRRKELAQLKQHLLQNNTMGADALELSELLQSEAYSTLVEVATIERERKQAEAQHQQEQQQQIIERQGQITEEQAQKDWDRDEVSKERDRVTRIQTEEIQALGRASDKDANEASFKIIKQESDAILRSRELDVNVEQSAADMKVREKKMSDDMKIKMEELKLRAKELEERGKQRKSKEFTSMINKN